MFKRRANAAYKYERPRLIVLNNNGTKSNAPSRAIGQRSGNPCHHSRARNAWRVEEILQSDPDRFPCAMRLLHVGVEAISQQGQPPIAGREDRQIPGSSVRQMPSMVQTEDQELFSAESRRRMMVICSSRQRNPIRLADARTGWSLEDPGMHKKPSKADLSLAFYLRFRALFHECLSHENGRAAPSPGKTTAGDKPSFSSLPIRDTDKNNQAPSNNS